MWVKGWRDQLWASLDSKWDLIIIGGGITGAGILREASRTGLRALLVEAHDFASGTSSRSSKLVHGGFRYLKNGQIKLTIESVHERERLLSEGRGLVNPLGFLMTTFKGDPIPGWVFGAGLIIYDILALKWGHRHYDAIDMLELCPILTEEGLRGGYRYFDAQTDDARLVLRVIQEAVHDGGEALNYARVTQILRDRAGKVCGVVLEDQAPDADQRTIEIQAPIVVNATGAWADDIRSLINTQHGISTPHRLRKLRGSHLVFPNSRLPLTRSVSFLHPTDGRPVFAFPWEGVTIVGTTDVDHKLPAQTDPSMDVSEAEYLMLAVQKIFPSQELTFQDVQCTFSGIRPVIDTGKKDPSKESREYVLWSEDGLLTVAGGKLTTFRPMAHDALLKVRNHLPGRPEFNTKRPVLDEPPMELIDSTDLSPATGLRFLGRYGNFAAQAITAAKAGELTHIADTPALWAELRWAARAEGVLHLDDLLLRRVRLGLLLPEGGLHLMHRIRSIVQSELGWDENRWEQEAFSYATLWKKCYHLGEIFQSDSNPSSFSEHDNGRDCEHQQRSDLGDRQRDPERTGIVV